jgi:hypothetical protein
MMLRLLLPLVVACVVAQTVWGQTVWGQAAWGQTVEQRRQAVETTLAQSPACARLGDLYWEIGDADDRLAWGQRGTSVTARQRVPLGAAGKWLFAAYVAERRQGHLGANDVAALNMTSGYSHLNVVACRGASTVADCPSPGPNPQHVGRFYYNNGHAQHLAVELGLGALEPRALAAEVNGLLRLSAPLVFDSPQIGSAQLSPAAYGDFLRALIDNRSALSPLLGSHATCTLCLNGLYSPGPKPWSYGLGHWVEDGPGDDGALSSPGLFGFYPWISADHTSWGVLARNHLSKDAWWASARCGALMRRAWLTARAQY